MISISRVALNKYFSIISSEPPPYRSSLHRDKQSIVSVVVIEYTVVLLSLLYSFNSLAKA